MLQLTGVPIQHNLRQKGYKHVVFTSAIVCTVNV